MDAGQLVKICKHLSATYRVRHRVQVFVQVSFTSNKNRVVLAVLVEFYKIPKPTSRTYFGDLGPATVKMQPFQSESLF